MRRACVMIRSSSVLISRSVPSATPMRVSSPISRARCAASPRARAVSARAAASRNPARMATRSRRGLVGWVRKPDRNSVGMPSGTSVSPSRPRATIAPPASTNDRMTSTGKIERLSASRRKTVGRSSATISSFAWRTARASTCDVSSAGATASARHSGGCRSKYLTAWPRPRRGRRQSRSAPALLTGRAGAPSTCRDEERGPLGRLHPLQAFVRLSVLGEDLQRVREHVGGLRLVAAVLVQQSARIVGQRFRRNLAAHALVRRLALQRGEIRVLHQPRRDVPDDVEHVVALHPLRFGLHDFACLGVHEADVDAEVTVEVDEGAEHDVAGANELADFGGGLRIDAALRPEVLLVEEVLDFLALDHACRRILRQLGDHHAGDAALEGVEIFLALTVGPTVAEGEDGDTGAGILAALLRAEEHRNQAQYRHDCTRAHSYSFGHRVTFMPSWAATTSSEPPRAFAYLRAAASKP